MGVGVVVLPVVDGAWLTWSKFGECSVSCGGGVQWRSRVCEPPLHDGKPCEGPEREQQNCSINACPGTRFIPAIMLQCANCVYYTLLACYALVSKPRLLDYPWP